MKHFTMNMTLAVAALTLAAGTISAQPMNAEIPFAFHVGRQLMQPGSYVVKVVPSTSGIQTLEFANSDSRQRAFVLSQSATDVPKAWAAEGLPKLRFACSEGHCSLTSLWLGRGSAIEFHSGRGKDGEPRIAEITLHPVRSGD